MLRCFAATVAWLVERRGDLKFIAALASEQTRAVFSAALEAAGVRERVTLFDGARNPGAKILVSGGTRCNVTNTLVTERDFNGASPASTKFEAAALTTAGTRTAKSATHHACASGGSSAAQAIIQTSGPSSAGSEMPHQPRMRMIAKMPARMTVR